MSSTEKAVNSDRGRGQEWREQGTQTHTIHAALMSQPSLTVQQDVTVNYNLQLHKNWSQHSQKWLDCNLTVIKGGGVQQWASLMSFIFNSFIFLTLILI